ncbi:MAG: VCBS repeat-containing protein, partial [Thermoguttaceae bacterium]
MKRHKKDFLVGVIISIAALGLFAAGCTRDAERPARNPAGQTAEEEPSPAIQPEEATVATESIPAPISDESAVGEKDASIRLRDVTERTGVTFVHTDGSRGERYIVETVSAGLALLDYDGDGDVDIYFLNGAPLPGDAAVGIRPRNALYRNDGDWKFTDVTAEAGVGDPGFGLGVATADYDNDGDQDIYLNNFGPNVLYRNNGDGTFTNVTEQAGVGNGDQVGAGTCFLDMDGDGDLDLFAANYVKFTLQNHVIGESDGFPIYAGPMDYPPSADTLYRNNGDGTFTDVSIAAGIAAHEGPGMGTVCADIDNDGDTDIIVGNDAAANFCFQNDGSGKFTQTGLMSGLAYDSDGKAQGTMGVECGDFNNDGLLDFLMTSYQRERTTLYRNFGDGFFEDATRETGAGAETLAHVTWGSGLVDFDNDGHRDIFIARGHLHDNIEQFDDSTTYLARNVLLRNTGNEKFVDCSDRCGDGLAIALSSRGAAF